MERPDSLSRAGGELVLVAAGVVVIVDLALGPSAATLLHSGHLQLLSGVDPVEALTLRL